MVDGAHVQHEDAAEGHELLEVMPLMGGVAVGPPAPHPPPQAQPAAPPPGIPAVSPTVQWVRNTSIISTFALPVTLIVVAALIYVDSDPFVATFVLPNLGMESAAGIVLFIVSIFGALTMYVASKQDCACRAVCVYVSTFGIAMGFGFGFILAIGGIASLNSNLENSNGVPVDAYYKGQVNADPERICAMFHAYNCSGYTYLCPKNSTSIDEPRSELQPPTSTPQPPTDAECPSVPHCVPASAAVLCGPLLERKVLSIAFPLLILVCMCALSVLLAVVLATHRLVELWRHHRRRNAAVYRRL